MNNIIKKGYLFNFWMNKNKINTNYNTNKEVVIDVFVLLHNVMAIKQYMFCFFSKCKFLQVAIHWNTAWFDNIIFMY